MASVTAGIGSIGMTEEHRDLAESIRGWLARAVPAATVRAALDAEAEERPAFWADLARQGLLSNHLPEEWGGADAGPLALAVALEETGRAMVPGPFLPTVLAGVYLAAALPFDDAKEIVGALADGTETAAVALEPGTMIAEPVAGGVRISGVGRPVIGAGLADWLVLAATGPDGVVVRVLVDVRGPAAGRVSAGGAAVAAEVAITPLKSLDRTRRAYAVAADGVFVPTARVVPAPTARAVPLDELAALLASAEAIGIADWCTRTAAEYAKVRVQFGKPIGQFQGTKHRCALMVSRLEQARSAVWDAAFVSGIETQDPAGSALPIAIAAALALDAAVECAKDCIQVLGGIGFTWEHDAHLYLRRALALRQVYGSAGRWRARVAELVRAGRRRDLQIELPEGAEGYRAAAREAFAAVSGLEPAAARRELAGTGYAAPYLPKPYGLGAGPVQQIVIGQEMTATGVRLNDLVIGNWVVPTLVKYGTAEQKDRFVLPTLRGEVIWCQLFSEPGAGSDLAALSTKATRVDGGWRLDGQKVWTSIADFAQWAICIARTSPDKPKHEGITYFLVDMSAAGVDVRPLREITGASLFNEVFLDGVFVPDDLVVGDVDGGWPLARNTLGNERVSLASGPVLGGSLEGLLTAVAVLPDAAVDAALADRVGALVCQGQSTALLGLRTTLRQITGMEQGPEASIRKLISMKLAQDVSELGLELLGPAGATEEAGPAQAWTSAFLSGRCLTIAGGTTEVQLNVIGERILGLPRD